MYEMYPTIWGDARLEGSEPGERQRDEQRETEPRRRPRREHSVAPRVRAEQR